MAAFNAKLVTVSGTFSGKTTQPIRPNSQSFPNMGALDGAIYSAVVSGGLSGTIGVNVLGYVGATTYYVAGLTNISAVGKYVLYPFGYTNTGAAVVPSTAYGPNDLHRIDTLVPGSLVTIEAVNGGGVSTTVVFSAAAWSR